MDKYQLLKEIIADYVNNMEGINEKRIDSCNRELSYTIEESKLFGLLRQNIHKLTIDEPREDEDGISQDKLVV